MTPPRVEVELLCATRAGGRTISFDHRRHSCNPPARSAAEAGHAVEAPTQQEFDRFLPTAEAVLSSLHFASP